MPTEFRLDIFDVEQYTNINRMTPESIILRNNGTQVFLRLRATPDFVSHIPEMMSQAPTVRFELVLDPLIFGVVPRSIVGNIFLISVAIFFGWHLVIPAVLNTIADITRVRQKIVRIKTH